MHNHYLNCYAYMEKKIESNLHKTNLYSSTAISHSRRIKHVLSLSIESSTFRTVLDNLYRGSALNSGSSDARAVGLLGMVK